ncbi:MAG: uracil-DNA glycosylase [Candidatus Paceibacterota bacterium]|jgi:DNA polymerase
MLVAGNGKGHFRLSFFMNSDLQKRERKLKRMHSLIDKCQKCRLGRTRDKAVPGEGPVGAEYMVIGQGPGNDEDKTGRPFVGRSGRLLTGFLEMAGLKREDVFITSAVKCFPTPPDNRKPKRDELEACFPYLKEQIKLVGPEKIILVGEVSFMLFFPGKRLKDLRGQWLENPEYEGRKFFATYHPAAALRFPGIWKKVIEKDFFNIGKKSEDRRTKISE